MLKAWKKYTLLTAIFFTIVAIPLFSFAYSSSDINTNDTLIYPVYTFEHIPDFTYEEIEERFMQMDSEIPLSFNSRIKAFIDYFTIRDREYTKSVLGKLDLYFPLFEKYFKEYGIPDEIKYLSIVESGLNPKAQSRVGAVGLWQFMPGTARMFGLKTDWYIDERMDPEKSTKAAAKYLKSLYSYFDDWELALAAYNAGPGKVRRAIRISGYKKKFWEIYRYLPRETRSYVPQFMAFMYVINHAEEHNFFIEEYKEFIPETDTIMVDEFLYFKTFADLTNTCPEDLEKMNPSVRRRAFPDGGIFYTFYIPADIKPYVLENRDYILDSAKNTGKEELEYLARHSVGSTWGRDKIVHTVRSGEVLGTIAEKYKVRVSDIRSWNNISGNLIRINQRLKIYVNQSYYNSINNQNIIVKEQAPSKQTSSPKPSASNKVHIVQPGDSLWEISRQYEGLTIERIKELNNLKSNKIKPGQKLIIG
jgi:membrane-bound lytic murein transglycosylase D